MASADGLELLDGQAWQNRLDDQEALWGQARLELNLGQLNVELLWEDEAAGEVAGDVVLLLLNLVLGLDNDGALLVQDLNLDLLWLEALDIKAQVQGA